MCKEEQRCRTDRAPWLEEISPWGEPWHTVMERAEWPQAYPTAPPIRGCSELEWRVARKRPSDVPAVLWVQQSGPAGLLSTPLARLLIEEEDVLLEELATVPEHDVAVLVRRLEAAAMKGHPPAFAMKRLSRSEAMTLLFAPAADAHVERLLDLATQQTAAHFGRKMRLYAPLYLSNECTNVCSYCGFNVKNRFPRHSLSVDEVRAEAKALAESGIENVLLLTGEAPKKYGLESLLAAVRAVSPYFRSVGVEVFPMQVSEYARLHEAGVGSVTIYQESYSPSQYRKVHLGGRKRDFLHRLGAPERVLESGIPKVGIGALLGLNSWRYEAIALARHADALRARYPQAEVTISFPRLRPAEGRVAEVRILEDQQLVHFMSALRLLLPDVGFVLSTRESAKLRDRLIPRLMTEISAGSSTAPGGYTAQSPGNSGEQFEIADKRSANEMKRRLALWGYPSPSAG